MHEILKVRLDLLKDLEKFLKKEKVKYYVSGGILINIYNNVGVDELMHTAPVRSNAPTELAPRHPIFCYIN